MNSVTETGMTGSSFFEQLTSEPPNSILGIAQQCKDDPHQTKINLTIGAYRNEQGSPQVLQCVRDAEAYIHNSQPDHEYLQQDGLSVFNSCAKVLMFGQDAAVVAENKVHTIQTVGGTGSVRLATEFLRRVFPDATCFVPDVTWSNHLSILSAASFPTLSYRYIDNTGCGFDFEGMLSDLKQTPKRSVVLLHSCAHNPTGVDPTEAQWQEILQVFIDNELFPLFDNAYQGFVTGDPDTDAFAVRTFADAGVQMVVCSSFSKNFGLYGDRTGALHVVTSGEVEAQKVGSVLRAIARTLYSTCPTQGARIVATILSDEQRRNAWLRECNEMANRMNSVRAVLHEGLLRHDARGSWDHVVQQRGMFSYTGLPVAAIRRLRTEFHIYMLEDGRISIAGLNASNVDRFCAAVAAVLGTNES